MVVVSRSIAIGRTIEEVFAFVADARNDPQWCPKVITVEQIDGDVPGPGARYKVLHRPIPLRPLREMDYRCVSWLRPSHIQWQEDDGTDVLAVTYTLEDRGRSTRFTQRSEGQLGAPRVLHPLMRLGFGRDIQRQLDGLKARLEPGGMSDERTPPNSDPTRFRSTAEGSAERGVVVVAFRRTHLAGVIALFATEGWSYADDAERAWRALTASGSTCLVAVAGDTVAGVAHVLSDGEIQAFLSILVVAKAFRRQGIGRMLVRDAFSRAGTLRIDLTSCADEFYEALGFRRLTAFRLSRDEL